MLFKVREPSLWFPVCETKIFHALSAMFYCTVESDDTWINVLTPWANSDHVVTHHTPCLKSQHYACSFYKGDICPKGG